MRRAYPDLSVFDAGRRRYIDLKIFSWQSRELEDVVESGSKGTLHEYK